MFFVSLLFNETLGWMRNQSGTTSLRALLYMDEIAGYFPPVANPPSKAPVLTLLKQARAFGVGIVLATQNSVDLDYKGLANCGTWFLGRLQTERDKARVLDDHCERLGRDPASITKTVNVGMAFTDEELRAQFGAIANYVKPGVLSGSVQEMVDKVAAYASAGATWVILAMRAPFDRDGLERFAAEVLPAVR